MFYCAMTTDWRGGGLPSFIIWSRLLGVKRMEDLWTCLALMVFIGYCSINSLLSHCIFMSYMHSPHTLHALAPTPNMQQPPHPSPTDHCPVEVVRSLVPKWNSFVFFEVSPSSFHQVSEVLSGSKTRLSINGWFHGPPTEYPAVHDGTTPMAALVPCDVS